MDHFRVTFTPDDQEILIHEGATLLEAASQAGIILTTPCGGKGNCGKCTVQLAASGQEVLACQYRVDRDLIVMVPSASRLYEHKILKDGPGLDVEIKPTVGERHRARSGPDAVFGLAVDVGTTTVVARLVDLTDGRCRATEAMLNPQTRYGDDVISRIQYAGSEAHLAELHGIIIGGVNELIRRLCSRAGIDSSSLYEACIVGNTTMNHLFMKFPVDQLGRAPYRAHCVDAHDVAPETLGLEMNPAGNVHCVENIAGFVGADTTAAALAVDMDLVSDTALVVDIGTNGELVLGTRDGLYAASCAAGPAMEGARIMHGSRAAGGAIEAVVFDDGDIVVDVIGQTSARSICGSGLIDAVAVLRDLGIVDATGRFVAPADVPASIRSRMMDYEGQRAFCLAWDGQTSRPGVALTQKDVREMQLAKGAIRAGIQLLLKKLALVDSDIDRVLLAGAFGNYIRPRSAVRIGLLPDVPLERIHFVGNAAASGAHMLLISDKCRARAAALARRIQYVEIAHEKDFADVFAEAMLLNP